MIYKLCELSPLKNLGIPSRNAKVFSFNPQRHNEQRKRLVRLIRTQARRQDLAAGGSKTRKRSQSGGTFLKYCIGCMQQPGGQT